jgi:hypothetical protein
MAWRARGLVLVSRDAWATLLDIAQSTSRAEWRQAYCTIDIDAAPLKRRGRVMTVTSADASGLTAGNYSLTVQATNSGGSGTGTATVL